MSERDLRRANRRTLAILLASLGFLYALAFAMKFGKDLQWW